MKGLVITSSSKDVHVSACLGKVGYVCIGEVKKVIFRRKRRHKRGAMKVYKCRYCTKWHFAGEYV